MKVLTIIALLLSVLGCASLTLKGQMVDVVYNRSSIKNCKFKGLVQGYSGWGGIAASGTGRTHALISLRNKVADLGGNVLYVPHISDGSHILGVSLDGKAYFCN